MMQTFLDQHEVKVLRLFREAVNRRNGKPLAIVIRVQGNDIEYYVTTPKALAKVDTRSK